MMNFREVWNWNQREEMISIRDCVRNCSYIAVDTEFPGCLRETPMDASDEARYSDMRFNTDRTKLIQLGFTFFIDQNIICTWEVNFSDFDETKDAKNERSIQFLKRNGLNLNKIRDQGIESKVFFQEFLQILKAENKKIYWIFFDALYDKGYLLKGLTGGKPLPESTDEFAESVDKFLGECIDVKQVAGQIEGMSSRYGLQRLADELDIIRVGHAHHAGSDSELTARVYNEIVRSVCQDEESEEDEQLEQEMVIVVERRYFLPPPPPRRPARDVMYFNDHRDHNVWWLLPSPYPEIIEEICF